MAAKNKRTKRRFGILDLLLPAAAVALAVSVLITINAIREAGPYMDREDTLYRYLQDESYQTLAARSLDAGTLEETGSLKTAELYRVGEYFRIAFLREAFEKNGNKQTAETYTGLAEDLKNGMGDLKEEAGRIDRLLEDAVR